MSALAAAVPIATAILEPLIEQIAEGLAEGLDEQAALDRALERMRATPLPPAVLPRVRRLIAEARAKRSEDDTRPTPVPR